MPFRRDDTKTQEQEIREQVYDIIQLVQEMESTRQVNMTTNAGDENTPTDTEGRRAVYLEVLADRICTHLCREINGDQMTIVDCYPYEDGEEWLLFIKLRVA